MDFPEFEMWTPETGPGGKSAAAGKNDSNVDAEKYFAIGDPRFNMHPGHLMWASIALYLHNHACDAVLSTNPEKNDEEVFQRARTIVFHLVQTTRMHQFIFDSVAHTRDHFRITYDPSTNRKDLGVLNFAGGIPNYLEFNHVYQAWHAFIPDEMMFGNETRPMRELMWNPELFHDMPLSDIAHSFTVTPVAKYGPHNFPLFLRDLTVQALQDERSQRLQPYNQYRQFFGLKPLESFQQLGVDDPEALADLYQNNIDNLELLPGILADNQASIPGNLLGDMQLVMVTLLAIEDLTSNDVVRNSKLWTEKYLTKGGFDFIHNYDFADVLELLLNGMMETPNCPFRAKDCSVPEEEWVDYDKAPTCFLCQSSVCSFVGMDLTEWFFDESGYMRYYVITQTCAIALIGIFYIALFAWLKRLFLFSCNAGIEYCTPTEETFDTSASNDAKSGGKSSVEFADCIRVCVLSVNSLAAFCLAIPVTWFWVQLVANPNWIEGFADSTYTITMWATSIISACFMAEILLRLSLIERAGYHGLLMIMAHHMVYYYLVIAVLATADVLVYKVSITILMGFVWEWPLYTTMLVFRFLDALKNRRDNVEEHGRGHRSQYLSPAEARFVKIGFPVMLFIYFATRILESAVVIQLCVCGVNRYFGENTVSSGPFWVVFPLAVIPLLFQIHAGWKLFVYWKHCRSRIANQEQDALAEPSYQLGVHQ